MSIIDLGAGKDKKLGAFGVDINPKNNPDMVYDLNKFPYPFQTDSYDVVFSKFCIEHLDNPLLFLKECKRIAKDKVVIITDNGINLHYIFRVNTEKSHPNHLHSWDIHSFKRLVERAGFRKINIKHVNYSTKKTLSSVMVYLFCKMFPRFNHALKVEAKVDI